jgi:hypothetical protein
MCWRHKMSSQGSENPSYIDEIRFQSELIRRSILGPPDNLEPLHPESDEQLSRCSVCKREKLSTIMSIPNCTLEQLRESATDGCVRCGLFLEAVVVYTSAMNITLPKYTKIEGNHFWTHFTPYSSLEDRGAKRHTLEVFQGIRRGESEYHYSPSTAKS